MIYTFTLKLRSVNELLSFVDLNSKSPCNVDVESGRYMIDGSSIMGMFAVDLFKRSGVIHIIGQDEECLELLNNYQEAGIKISDPKKGNYEEEAFYKKM